jgi:hypothetical protein
MALAKYSNTYKGLVDKGTYTEPERKNGRLDKRIAALTAEGYTGITTVTLTDYPW